MGYNSPVSYVHEISQARMLESAGFPTPGDLPGLWIERVSFVLTGMFFTTETAGKLRLRGYWL